MIAGFFSIASFVFVPVDGALIAYERFSVLKIAELLQKVFVIVFMVIALYTGFGLFALVFINGFVGFNIKLFKFLYIRKHAHLQINIGFFDKSLAKELFSFSSWVFIISIAQRLLVNIVPTILGIFSGSEQIAIFSIAITLQSFIWSFAYALNGLFLPTVTRMVSRDENRHEVSNLMIKVGRLQLMVIGLLITGLIVMGKSFFQLWMGADFIQSYYVLLFLLLPGIVTFSQEIANTLLFVENEIKYRAILFILASVISVIIGILLSPRFGALGTAVGVGTAMIFCHVIGMNIVYSKVLKLEIGRFFKSVHLKMTWPLLIAGCLSLLGQKYYHIDSWFSFLISGAAFVTVYFVLTWSFVMNKEEKNIVLSLINKIKS